MQGKYELFPPDATETKSKEFQNYNFKTKRSYTIHIGVPDHENRVDLGYGEMPTEKPITITMTVHGNAQLRGAHNDTETALRAPAIFTFHSGDIHIQGDTGLPDGISLQGKGNAESLADDASGNPLLAYEIGTEHALKMMQRLKRLVISNEQEQKKLARVSEIVNLEIMMLQTFAESKGRKHKGLLQRALQTHKWLRIPTEWRDWPLPEIKAKFYPEYMSLFIRHCNAISAAHAAIKPKTRRDNTIAVLNAGPHAIKSLAEGVVEIGRMARDLGMKVGDEIGEQTGLWDWKWKAWSGVGKAYEQGKSTTEILWGIVDGVIDRVDKAVDAARQGDYAAIADLGAEIALDLLLTGGLGTASKGAKAAKAAAAARGAKTLARLQKVMNKVRQVRATLGKLKKVPKRAVDELVAVAEAIKHGFSPQRLAQAIHDPGLLVSGAETVLQTHARVRMERARGRALAKLESAGVGGKGESARLLNESLLKEVEELAGSAPAARRAVADVHSFLADGTIANPKKFIDELASTMYATKLFEGGDAAKMIRNATRAADPIQYLDDIRWLSTLEPKARHLLAKRIAQKRPPDLTWLRNQDVDLATLNKLAADPMTDWATMQRRAKLAETLPPEVQAVIGKRIDEVTTAPPDTTFYKTNGRIQLRWKPGKRRDRPKLTLDSQGRIAAGAADDMNRAALAKAMTKEHGAKPPGHQDHHLIPVEVARDSDLLKEAAKRGKPKWDLNHPNNGMRLPSADEYVGRGSASHLPKHRGSHRKYTAEIKKLVNDAETILRRDYGSLDKVPPEVLTDTIVSIQRQAKNIVEQWRKKHGAKHDNRLASVGNGLSGSTTAV